MAAETRVNHADCGIQLCKHGLYQYKLPLHTVTLTDPNFVDLGLAQMGMLNDAHLNLL